MQVTVDLDEGRYVELGCLSCRDDVRATVTIATPIRLYVIALQCDECFEDIVKFDQFTNEVAS